MNVFPPQQRPLHPVKREEQTNEEQVCANTGNVDFHENVLQSSQRPGEPAAEVAVDERAAEPVGGSPAVAPAEQPAAPKQPAAAEQPAVAAEPEPPAVDGATTAAAAAKGDEHAAELKPDAAEGGEQPPEPDAVDGATAANRAAAAEENLGEDKSTDLAAAAKGDEQSPEPNAVDGATEADRAAAAEKERKETRKRRKEKENEENLDSSEEDKLTDLAAELQPRSCKNRGMQAASRTAKDESGRSYKTPKKKARKQKPEKEEESD